MRRNRDGFVRRGIRFFTSVCCVAIVFGSVCSVSVGTKDAVPVYATEEESGGYMYGQLTEKQKGIYRQLESLSAVNTEITFVADGYEQEAEIQEDIPVVMQAFRFDRLPDWLADYEVTVEALNDGTLEVSLDATVQKYYSPQLEAQVEELIATVRENMDADYDRAQKVKYIALLLDGLAEYDNSSFGGFDVTVAPGTKTEYFSWSYYGTLLKGVGVCESYAKAFQKLCEAFDVPCVMVSSLIHIWNYVQLDDGNWYMIDVTGGLQNNFFLRGADYQYYVSSIDGLNTYEPYVWWGLPYPEISTTQYCNGSGEIQVSFDMSPYEKAEESVETVFYYQVNEDGQTCTITDYQGTGDVIIPSELDGYVVTEIGPSAFERIGNVGSLSIPDTVTIIHDNAFYLCDKLTGALTLPDSIKAIGAHAFDGCKGFDGTLTLPAYVETIGVNAFNYCENLTGSLYLPDTLTQMGEAAFNCCSSLDGSLHIASGLTQISDSAFRYCSKLTGELKLPEGIKAVGNLSFMECDGLTGDVELPDSVMYVDPYAFGGSTGLENYIVNDNEFYSVIDGVLYNKDATVLVSCLSGRKTVPTIPEGVECIGEKAFVDCGEMEGKLQIPASLKQIGDSAFFGCKNLSGDLILGDNIVSIGENAFCDCTGFAGYRLKLPAQLTEIPSWGFKGCGFVGELEIPVGVTKIEDYAFADNSFTGNLVLPEGIVEIQDGAFVRNAFSGQVVIPEGTELGMTVFAGCDKLESVVILSEIEELRFGFFQGCTSLGTVVLPDSITYIGGSVFDQCEALTQVVFPANCTFADSWSFARTGIKNIELPDGMEIITESMFQECEELEYIILPKSIKEIRNGAFYECDSFMNVYYYGTEEEWGQIAIASWNPSLLQATVITDFSGNVEDYATPSDPIEAFVTRMYRIILEREPDAGSSTWINGLKDGSMTGVRVADGFVLSEEMLNKDISNEEFVKILYRAFFGREADAEGLATWKNLLDAGCKKTYVFAGFANSTEFGNLCAEAGIVQGRAAEYLADRQTGLSEADYKVWCFVERMYMEVLNRTADEPGVRSWVGALQDGSMTGVQVADGFIMSEEFLAKNMTNEEYVRIMYRAFFGRDADPEGLATWTNALATGWTKQDVFAGFANSNEFGVLCGQAGIVQGTAEGK